MVDPSFSSYRAAWDAAYKTDPTVPLNLDLELAATCNLSCPFCFWGEADFNSQMMKAGDDGRPLKRLMPADLALRLIDEAAELGIPAIKFNWRGESTLHPDYSRIIGYAAAKNVPIGSKMTPERFNKGPAAFLDLLVNTNANCKDHAIPGLMAATKVAVSLDSCEPKTYAKMRVGGNLDRAIQVTRELIRWNHPNLWIRRVLTKENQHEPFAANVQKIFGPTGYRVSQHACFDRNADERHQVHVEWLWKDRLYCGYPSQRIMVAANGLCYPCCVDYDGTIPVGDVRKQTLKEVWEGETMVKLRATLRANDLDHAPAACQKCTSWMAYDAPERSWVHDKEIKVPA